MKKNHELFTFATFMLGSRTKLDLTQVEMAKRLGISKAVLCEIEKGLTLVSPDAAVRYAKKLNFLRLSPLKSAFGIS